MELRVKDLQRYLMSNKISTKDCVGKFLRKKFYVIQGINIVMNNFSVNFFEVDNRIHSILRIFEHLL